MKKILLNSIFLTGLIWVALLAGCAGTKHLYNSEVVLASGIHAFLNNNYPAAVKKLELATSNPHRLDPNQLSEAYSYLSRSYYQTHLEKSAKHFEDDMLLKMEESYHNCLSIGDDGIHKTAIINRKKEFAQAIYDEGFKVYNGRSYQKAFSYFSSCVQLDDSHYKGFIMLGFVHYAMDDSRSAISNFSNALTRYKALPNDSPDDLLQSAYYSLATLQVDEGNAEGALASINEGISKFQTNEDLHRVRLSAYQDLPEKSQEAIPVIRQFIREFGPDDEAEALLAAMLIKTGRSTEGLAMCHGLLRKNPNHINSLQQIASHYINEASRYQQAFTYTFNLEREFTLESLVEENMLNALPYLYKLQKIEPGNMQWEHYIKTAEFYLAE